MTRVRAEAGKNIKTAAENKEAITMRKSLKILGLAVLLVTVFAVACFAWNPSEEVLRLHKEVPSYDTLGNPQAVVWLKNHEMRYNNDKSVDIFHYTIISFGKRIPDNWREHRICAPAGGELRIGHVAIYNPATGRIEGIPKVTEQTIAGGMKIYTVHLTDDACNKVLVLVENEKRLNQDGIDMTVTVADEFPVWEQKIAVLLPKDKPLYWYASKMKEPQVLNGKTGKVYFWAVTNQTAWHGSGIRVFQRPFISFSSCENLVPRLQLMQGKADAYAKVEMPASAPSDSGKLINWMEASERNETLLPRNTIRPLNMLPKNGPWTAAERTLLLNGWLNKLGRGTKIWWQAPAPVRVDSSVADDFWTSPVIVSASGKRALYYQAGQGVEYGDVSPFLAGTDIYRLSDKKPQAAAENTAKAKKKKTVSSDGFDTREVKAGSPADHKLSLLWNLKLNENGVADGTLSATINGAWAGIFSDGVIPTKEVAARLITRKINLAIPGMTLTSTNVKLLSTGYKLDFKVHCAPGIVQNKNMLLKLPGGIPEILGQLLYDNEAVTFRFPFVIEQRVRMSTPKGYKCFQNDINNVIGTKKTSQLVEKIHTNPVKNILEADCVWILKKLKQEMDDAQVLSSQIGAFLAWPNLNLPYRK